jgi:hypothetical protein
LDPRKIGLRWPEFAAQDVRRADPVPRFAPYWSQLGGSPGHTGLAPFPVPLELEDAGFIPLPAAPNRPEVSLAAAAVVDAGYRAWIVRPHADDSAQLCCLDFNTAPPSWAACGDALPGRASHPPAITPRGLVVVGTSGRLVQAWDGHGKKLAWRLDLGSAVRGICVTYDGLILCSTFQRLAALDQEGKELWSFTGFTDFEAPACVRPDGRIAVVSRSGRWALLDAEGRVALLIPDGPSLGEVSWPPVAGSDSAIWLVTPRGVLAQLGADGKFAKPKVFDTGWSIWPLGLPVLARGNVLSFPEGATLTLPSEGQVVALAAEDAGQQIYAAIGNKVFRIRTVDEKGATKPLLARNAGIVRQGEVVRGGLALVPGMLVVTTTHGIQLLHDMTARTEAVWP